MRWLRLALKVSVLGIHKQHKIGAVLVRGGHVLATAYNISRPYGKSNGGRHAEDRVLGGRDCSGAVLYVARNNGRMSRPCPKCMKKILASGISKIVYFDWEGNYTEERL